MDEFERHLRILDQGKKGDPEVESAISWLVERKSSPRFIREVTERLRGEWPERALEVLERAKDPEAITYLVDVAGESGVSNEALANALIEIDSKKAANHISGRLSAVHYPHDPAYKARVAKLAPVLGYIPDPEAARRLLDIIENSMDLDARFAALEGLGNSQDPRVKPALERIINSNTRMDFRISAAKSLVRTGSPSAKYQLASLLGPVLGQVKKRYYDDVTDLMLVLNQMGYFDELALVSFALSPYSPMKPNLGRPVGAKDALGIFLLTADPHIPPKDRMVALYRLCHAEVRIPYASTKAALNEIRNDEEAPKAVKTRAADVMRQFELEENSLEPGSAQWLRLKTLIRENTKKFDYDIEAREIASSNLRELTRTEGLKILPLLREEAEGKTDLEVKERLAAIIREVPYKGSGIYSHHQCAEMEALGQLLDRTGQMANALGGWVQQMVIPPSELPMHPARKDKRFESGAFGGAFGAPGFNGGFGAPAGGAK